MSDHAKSGWFIYVHNVTSSTPEREALYIVLASLSGLAFFMATVAVLYLLHSLYCMVVEHRCRCLGGRSNESNNNSYNITMEIVPLEVVRLNQPPPAYSQVIDQEPPPPTYETVQQSCPLPDLRPTH